MVAARTRHRGGGRRGFGRDLRGWRGNDCWIVRRTDRHGYKAGALEVGRHRTNAEFIAVFDADFVPPQDYLPRMIPYFYLPDGTPDARLALVQAQWGHLNHHESALTRAQSLWVDDHHTLQMSWRSARWGFVNFTGTAGVWRASAIEVADGWRAASLIEDCELSFRILFTGYRTRFVKDIVVPAELPATYTAYKAQQRRWTQGRAQLQRLHLARLPFQFRCSLPRRIHLLYHMCVSWQWPAWAAWITLLPLLIFNGYWFGVFGTAAGVALYLARLAIQELLLIVDIVAIQDVPRRVEPTDPAVVGHGAVERARDVTPVALLPPTCERRIVVGPQTGVRLRRERIRDMRHRIPVEQPAHLAHEPILEPLDSAAILTMNWRLSRCIRALINRRRLYEQGSASDSCRAPIRRIVRTSHGVSHPP